MAPSDRRDWHPHSQPEVWSWQMSSCWGQEVKIDGACCHSDIISPGLLLSQVRKWCAVCIGFHSYLWAFKRQTYYPPLILCKRGTSQANRHLHSHFLENSKSYIVYVHVYFLSVFTGTQLLFLVHYCCQLSIPDLQGTFAFSLNCSNIKYLSSYYSNLHASLHRGWYHYIFNQTCDWSEIQCKVFIV